jgi:superfamily II DNA or RNA helicase
MVDAAGVAVWRAGPLDPADLAWVRELADAFPVSAHALAVPGSRPLRVRSPEALIRALWDAMADSLVRTAAAPAVVSSPAFAGSDPMVLEERVDWLVDGAMSLSSGALLGLRIDPSPLELDDTGNAVDGAEPEGDVASGFRAVLQLRSTADPSLVVDAGHLWDQPDVVLSRFGPEAETDLLRALRRGATVWPPLTAALRQATPTAIDLDDAAIGDLLGAAAESLAGVGVEVLWPASLVGDGLALTAVVTPAPGQVVEAGFSLESLLEFRWRLTLDGEALDPDEIAALAEAKRPLVRLRGRWLLLDPALLERLQRPPRSRLTGMEALSAVLAGSAEIDGELRQVVGHGAVRELADRLVALTESPEQVATPPGLVATLRPYQQRGVSWMNAMCEIGFGGCLADDMGLGKTIQVIALHLHRRASGPGPTLVVCPASLLGTWEREVQRFAPDVPVRRFHGGGRHLRDLADDEIVLVTYGVVVRDSVELATVGWGLVVADEAQHAKNPHTRTAKELRAVPAPARLALTGTPVENRLSELWSILDWTTPGLLGPLETFTRRVAVPVERHRDRDATQRFAAQIRPFLLRRKKTDPGIAPELPAKTESDLVVPLSAEQVTLYEAVVRETLAQIATKQGIERSGLVFKLLTALKQICNHPAHYLKQTAPLGARSGKLSAFDDLSEVILAGGDSMLVFTQYTAMGTLLQQHLHQRGVPSLFLHGGVPVRRREEMVAQFQAGKAPVFVLSLKAGGTGLTLTRATHVVHYDRWWNPAVEDQATDRAYRIGQDRPVQVHRLITEGTLEDRIAALIDKKRELADAVISSGEGWIAELSDTELGDLVCLRSAQ